MKSLLVHRCSIIMLMTFTMAALLVAGVRPSAAQTKNAHEPEVAFPGLEFIRPVDLQHAGDNSNRLFVVEQAGRIYVFTNSRSAAVKKLFLDIRDKVDDSGNEEGLLGLAFHPQYESNGFFYVNYTASNPNRTVIARYKVSADADVADPKSEVVLLEFKQPYSNHNGGQVSFGPDGYLYIAVGDGGSGGDPQRNGQSLSTLLGKILRIDVDKPSGGKQYGIPADNPFVARNDAQKEIYAYGLRNPWRFSFDQSTGTLWAGDVGQGDYEEIDIIKKGSNYGWRTMEGRHCFDPSSGCKTVGLELPVWEYGRSEGISITGGFVYRGKSTPALQGKYIYADYGTGNIWALDFSNPSRPVNTRIAATNLHIASFGVDQDSELYMCSFDGKIYRF